MGNTDPTVHTRNVQYLPIGSSLWAIVTHFFLIPGSLCGLKCIKFFATYIRRLLTWTEGECSWLLRFRCLQVYTVTEQPLPTFLLDTFVLTCAFFSCLRLTLKNAFLFLFGVVNINKYFDCHQHE